MGAVGDTFSIATLLERNLRAVERIAEALPNTAERKITPMEREEDITTHCVALPASNSVRDEVYCRLLRNWIDIVSRSVHSAVLPMVSSPMATSNPVVPRGAR